MIYETDLEQQALSRLRVAREIGSLPAMQQAEAILDRVLSNPAAAELRQNLRAGRGAFPEHSHAAQRALYKAIHFGRGATLDTVDVPLNNRNWLRARFDAIRKLETEESRQRGIDAIVNWTNPGPGGFYDDLGDPLRRPHLVMGRPTTRIPRSSRAPDGLRLGARLATIVVPACRRARRRDASNALRGSRPLAAYKLRVVYAGDMFQAKVRLVAGESMEVHPYLLKPRDMKPLEFDVPARQLLPACST